MGAFPYHNGREILFARYCGLSSDSPVCKLVLWLFGEIPGAADTERFREAALGLRRAYRASVRSFTERMKE